MKNSLLRDRLVLFKFVFASCLLVAFVQSGEGADDGSRTQYYVATAEHGGDDSHEGTMDEPFLTIGKAASVATAWDTVYVKAGVYRESLVFGGEGNRNVDNVCFEGYRQTPGDIEWNNYSCNLPASEIDEDISAYNPGDELQVDAMPLLQGDGTLNVGVQLNTSRGVTLRNFQVEGFKLLGINVSSGTGATLENIIVKSIGDAGADNDYGRGFRVTGGAHTLQRCIAVNASGENFSVSGQPGGNTIEDCISFCDDNGDGSDTDRSATDYYFFVSSSSNNIRRCKVERTEGLKHPGHGFHVRDTQYNSFYDCEVKNTVEGLRVEGSDTRNNSFHRCRVTNGSIVLDELANNNSFNDCVVDGKGGGSGVAVWDTSGDGPGEKNFFVGCEFKNLDYGVDFHRFACRSTRPSSYNRFTRCEFQDIYVLFRTERPNYATTFIRSKFCGILHYHQDVGFPLRTPLFNTCTFSNNGFQTPLDNGNITDNTDTCGNEDGEGFDPVDITSNLVGHWKFDETGSEDTAFDSAGDNNGDLLGDASWSTEGRLGGCLTLGGEDGHVDMGDSLDLPGSDLTIAAWINVDSWDHLAGIATKFSGRGNYRLLLSNSDDVWGNRLGAGASDGDGTFQQIATYTPMDVVRWYHVAVVFNTMEQETYMYVDGILVSTQPHTIARGETSTSLIVGANFYGEDRYFKGSIDDLRIYSCALDRFQLKALAELTEFLP